MVKAAGSLLLLFILSCLYASALSAADKPSAHVRGGNSPGPVISIDHPDSLVSHHDINIQYGISTREVLTRQMLVVQYRLQSNDAFITLRTDIVPATGESYVALPARKTKLPETSAKRYQYELNVLVNASRSGRMTLRVPALIYSEGGKDRYRFHFAEQVIEVKALPPYLPPYIPMVPLQMESAFSTSWSWYKPLQTGKIYYWTIKLQAEKADELSLPDLRQQLLSNATIQFLPAEITRETHKDHDSMIQRVTYTIPFTLKKSGYVNLPEIGLQHFDPESRRLSSRHYHVQGIFVLNLYLQWLIVIVLLALCFLFFWKTRFFAVAAYRNGRQYYQARHLLAQAATVAQMRMAMNSIGESWGWSANLSLSQWASRWQHDISPDVSMSQSLASLSRSLYGPEEDQDSVKSVRDALGASYLRQWMMCLKAALRRIKDEEREPIVPDNVL